MMRRILFTGIFCLLFLGQDIFAQTNFLRLDSVNGNQYVTSFDDSIPITGRLWSFSDSAGAAPNSYQGDVIFYMLSDSMIVTGAPARAFDTLSVALSPAGLVLTTYLDIRPNEMRSGPNVIIVWPGYTSPGVTALDSSWIGVTVNGYLSVPSEPEPEIALYPNPVFQQFYLLVPQTGMTRVLILDLSGKILHEQTLSSGSMGTVSVEQFPPGLYIVNLQLPDGSVRSLRLVRSR